MQFNNPGRVPVKLCACKEGSVHRTAAKMLTEIANYIAFCPFPSNMLPGFQCRSEKNWRFNTICLVLTMPKGTCSINRTSALQSGSAGEEKERKENAARKPRNSRLNGRDDADCLKAKVYQ